MIRRPQTTKRPARTSDRLALIGDHEFKSFSFRETKSVECFKLSSHSDRKIQNLTYKVFYIGSGSLWGALDAERQNIDACLEAAMTDTSLNTVFEQYFDQQTVCTSVIPSALVNPEMAWPPSVCRQDFKKWILMLYDNNELLAKGSSYDDYQSFAVLFVCPPGTILDDTDDGGGGSQNARPDSDAAHGNSLSKGIGGFHSFFTNVDGRTIYYAASTWSDGENGAAVPGATPGAEGWAPWKNVCAALYHELAEIRTNPDVACEGKADWYQDTKDKPNDGPEIGDLPILYGIYQCQQPARYFQEVGVDGLKHNDGKAPIELLWSNHDNEPWHPHRAPKPYDRD
jgi:hypothetical protein